MKYIQFVGAAFAAMVAAAVMSAPAFAGPTYTFTTSTGAQGTITAAVITLSQGAPTDANPSTDENSVTIDLLMQPGTYGIINNQVPFTFELNAAGLLGTLSISSFIDPPGGTYTDPHGDTDQFSLETSKTNSITQPNFGTFNTAITSTAGNGSSHCYGCNSSNTSTELKFVLTSTGTLDTERFRPERERRLFSADIGLNGNTGPQAWEIETKKVPEPGTILLFGTALAAFGLNRRRRHSNIA